MDFIETLQYHYGKLRNKETVNMLWREIIKEGRYESDLDELIEYSFHYPVDTEAYLDELHCKFRDLDKPLLRTIDGHLKAYLITFLYYCSKIDDKRVSMETTVKASSLYLKLIALPGIGKIFFERNMFKMQLFTCMEVSKNNTISDGSKTYLLKCFKKYCLEKQLEPFFLKAAANVFTSTLITTCGDAVDDITNIDPVPMYCINSLRELILDEDDGAKVKCILESLFRCLRKSIIDNIPNKQPAIDVITIFIRDVLRHELDEEKFEPFLDAFCVTWGQQDFVCYKEAVVIMNLLKVQYYKELVRKMVIHSQAKFARKYLVNITYLLSEMLNNPPPFSLDKIEVLYFCAVRNVLYQFINKNRSISDRAIETIMEMCKIKDNSMLNSMFTQFECNGKFINISVEAIFLSFLKIVDDKWSMSSRNQHLLIIFAKFLKHSKNVNIELVQNTLEAICRDASPSALSPYLQILHELYCAVALRQDVAVAHAILNLMYRNAMHPDTTSMEYVDHLFKSMCYPSVIDGISYNPTYYSNLLLSSQFEYEPLFIKFQSKIRRDHVCSAIRHLDYGEAGSGVLVCCLLDYFPYTDIKAIIKYIADHFHQLAGYISAGFILASLQKILRYRINTEVDFPQLDIIQSLIMSALIQQTFPVPSIKPAFELFESIRNILKLPKDQEQLDYLLLVTSERAYRRLHVRGPGDNSVFMYLSEICLLLKRLPEPTMLKSLESYISDPRKLSAIKLCMPEIHLQLLSLFTTLAMIKKSKVPITLTYLHESLHSSDRLLKFLSLKLLFSLCKEVTHEFGEVIKFALKEMVVADPCLVRMSVEVLEDLVHNDYIKFESEDFFRFVYLLGCDDLNIFMKDLLTKRFLHSSQNDMSKFYIQTIVYINMSHKVPNYHIRSTFVPDLLQMHPKINRPKEILAFLFDKLPIRKKFNILCEISSVIEDLLRGQVKVDDGFINTLLHFLATYKFMKTANLQEVTGKNYYENVCKQIETQIVNHDQSYQKESYYMEYESEIRRCTLALLKLLFIENEQLAIRIQTPMFDTIMHWIDFVKTEIIHYVHVERGNEYHPYFLKLVQYYQRNKARFVISDR